MGKVSYHPSKFRASIKNFHSRVSNATIPLLNVENYLHLCLNVQAQEKLRRLPGWSLWHYGSICFARQEGGSPRVLMNTTFVNQHNYLQKIMRRNR